MTESRAKALPFARIALVLAALVAAFAIGFAISRNQTQTELEVPAVAKTPTPGTLAELEQQAKADPGSAEAWRKLGLARFNEGLFTEAADAYEKAVSIDPAQAVLWSALGEARVMASDRATMPAMAAEAFETAVTLDPDDPRARYFLAVRRDLSGDHAGAIDDWLAVLEDAPQDTPWRSDVIRTIERAGKTNGIAVAGRLAAAGAASPSAPSPPNVAKAIPGPTAQDVAAASQMPRGEQRKMAEGMVARLEQRLEREPGNVDGWVMLMRSRQTLGQPNQARQALADAIKANPARAEDLRRHARSLGIQ